MGVDLWNGTTSQLSTFRNQTGITFPLLLNGATATGGNVATLYGTYDNYLVVNKQGIVRYHAALQYPLGNRFQIDEIRATVDSLVAGFVDAPGPALPTGLALAVSPQPARSTAQVRLTLPQAARRARIEVLDAAGRRLALLHDGPAAAGDLRLAWPATAPAGVHLVRAEVDGAVRTRRLVVLR